MADGSARKVTRGQNPQGGGKLRFKEAFTRGPRRGGLQSNAWVDLGRLAHG